ncbi:hypothetical protein [Lysinibacillus sp. Bpr_S20]|uniref:hypothetical protein n=1 Tax=Lysinibacillus sp. Bpr_S20 TaxID=2933964 RepID=UPI002012DBBB|nr:hypothetical protein [Lysinibacillus sp. Bpr_S20]MCL1702002.1 hypothetical protein [Lysinibacillus sp. Bpr_S20]
MKQLIWWEWKLLWQQKLIYIMLVAILSLLWISKTYFNMSIEELNAFEEIQNPITEKDIQEAREILATKEFEIGPEVNVFYRIDEAQTLMDKQSTIINQLKARPQTSALEKEITMREQVNTMYIEKTEYPIFLSEFLGGEGLIAIGILLIVGLYNLFARDQQTGMIQYTLTSKFGRSKLVQAKLVVTLLYTMVIYIGTVIFSVIFNIYRTGSHVNYWMYIAEGFNSPIQFHSSLSMSPYTLTLFEFLLIQLLFLLLGSICFSIICLSISSVVKASFISFLFSMAIFFLPFLIVNLLNLLAERGWIAKLFIYTIPYIMQTKRLFEAFYYLQISNKVILAPFIALGLLLVIIISSIVFLKIYNKKWRYI